MKSEIAVHASHVVKAYPFARSAAERFCSSLLPFIHTRTFLAVNDVSFDVHRGENIGVLGLNGSGKSTLMKLIAGIESPSSGTLTVEGNALFFGASAGMDMQMTGRQNIEYKCMLLGYNRRQIKSMMASIIDFAEIGSFIDQPLRTYSSGMRARLGFSISTSIETDILIVDEALAVGDSLFFHKCIDRMNLLRQDGKTVFYVTHSTGLMQDFCDRIFMLNGGKLIADDKPETVLSAYKNIIDKIAQLSDENRKILHIYTEQHRIRE